MNVERHTRAWLSTILQRCRIVSVFLTAAFYFCEAQPTIPIASNNICLPVIRVAHSTISCFDLQNSNNVQLPTVTLSCGGTITDLTYQDTYYELAARRVSGFAGYFDLARWEKKSGDGGVDVTGAPNGILVEGANIAKVSVAPKAETILRIVIPAEGYAMFNWKNIGGSNLLLETLVNGKAYPVRSKSACRTPLLRTGDTLALRLTAHEATEAQFSDFNFYTNAIGVTERRWTATSSTVPSFVFHQYITVVRPPIANIIFPDAWETPGASTVPNTTGFPVLDEDGNLNTLQDQHLLNEGDCGFQVRWEDKTATNDKGSSIIRRWIVQDVYNGNVVEHTQLIQTSDANPEASTKQKIQPTKTGSGKNKSVSVSETSKSARNYGKFINVR
jgi:hypothetical protein